MGSVVARLDDEDGAMPRKRAVARPDPRRRHAAIIVVVAGVVALHAALFALLVRNAPPPHAELVRVTTIAAAIIAPMQAMLPESEGDAQTPSAGRPNHETVRNITAMPQARPAPLTHARDLPRPAAPVSAAAPPPHTETPPEAARPPQAVAEPQSRATRADHAAQAQAQAQSQAQAAPSDHAPEPQALAAPARDAPRRVAHLDCALAKPDYPAQSLRRAEAGTAVIELETAVDGRVSAARVVSSSGYARLDEAARDAALVSHCQPYMEDGRSVPVRADVPVTFNLTE
ncbi:MAG TPA: energy transducer TonB [Paraburkholderia sp.]|uniref:energy transducer TonB n=1 Tax=Paraburkholderia sp. TaxID=1926495 RepID=UPI002C2563B6|nr:energy transducer TonB [Paraburkholderia sp.]HTR09287.1 energy transducer TonB [Paraburkholderia sp.]